MTRLLTLEIRNYRNIESASLAFPSAGVAIVGENGQGKTNLLEAIYYLQILRSMRGARDQELVRFDAPAFFLEASIATEPHSYQHAHQDSHQHAQPRSQPRSHTHTMCAAFERTSKRKKIVCDGAVITKLSNALGTLPSVIISPRDTDVVAGAPSERRRFLDVLLSLTSRRYLTALQAYRTALAHRNAALRDATRNGTGKRHPPGSHTSSSHASSSHTSGLARHSARLEESIAVWEPTIAEHGAFLIAARFDWVRHNAIHFTQLCQSIGERTTVRMRYTSTIESPDNAYERLLDALERKRPIDLKRGLTHAGPHRDDLALTLDHHDLRTYGSAGQQRTAAIALRMLEAEALRAHHGTPPILLLDDPFAELDARRSAHILALLKNAGIGQTILAVPRSTDIPAELTSLDRWGIENGTIVPQSSLAP